MHCPGWAVRCACAPRLPTSTAGTEHRDLCHGFPASDSSRRGPVEGNPPLPSPSIPHTPCVRGTHFPCGARRSARHAAMSAAMSRSDVPRRLGFHAAHKLQRGRRPRAQIRLNGGDSQPERKTLCVPSAGTCKPTRRARAPSGPSRHRSPELAARDQQGCGRAKENEERTKDRKR